MSAGLQLKDLSPYYQRLEIIQATAEQIIKDFEIFGEEIKFSGNAETAYSELKSKILHIVSNMLKYDSGKLVSLLYRIDLSEKKLKEIFQNTSLNIEERISEMIIERELKKVIVRKYYKGG